MKITFTREDGNESFFILKVLKVKYGYKPQLKTESGNWFTLGKGDKGMTYQNKADCIEMTKRLISYYKDYVILH